MKKKKYVRVTAAHIAKAIYKSAELNKRPEEKLWIAVIQRAAADAVGCGNAEERDLQKEARRFFRSPNFKTICALVGIDPQFVLDCIAKHGRTFEFELEATRANDGLE